MALDRMADLGPVRVGRTLTLPELSLLRGDSRLRVLCKNVDLPEYQKIHFAVLARSEDNFRPGSGIGGRQPGLRRSATC